MNPSIQRSVGLPAFAALLLGGCAVFSGPPHHTLGSPTLVGTLHRGADIDSLRGTVAVVGAEPLTRVVLQSLAGEQLRLEGRAAPLLRRLDGIDVLVAGRAVGGRLQVGSFRVVGANGRPAADGVLTLEGTTAVLMGPNDVSIRFTPAPLALRDHIGSRVWIAGVAGGEPEAWGVIDPR